jgi:hypothetical protein
MEFAKQAVVECSVGSLNTFQTQRAVFHDQAESLQLRVHGLSACGLQCVQVASQPRRRRAAILEQLHRTRFTRGREEASG